MEHMNVMMEYNDAMQGGVDMNVMMGCDDVTQGGVDMQRDCIYPAASDAVVRPVPPEVTSHPHHIILHPHHILSTSHWKSTIYHPITTLLLEVFD